MIESGSSGSSHAQPVAVGEVVSVPLRRLATGIEEFDRVFGGGLVPGSVALLGGEPGVGKSTLVLEVGAALSGQGTSVLIATGEESQSQVGLRARRIDAAHHWPPQPMAARMAEAPVPGRDRAAARAGRKGRSRTFPARWRRRAVALLRLWRRRRAASSAGSGRADRTGEPPIRRGGCVPEDTGPVPAFG